MPRTGTDVPAGVRIGAALLLLAALCLPAYADLTGVPVAPPSLSAAEQGLVTRNPAFEDLAIRNPWLLRVVLDEIAAPPGAADAKTSVVLDVEDLTLLQANSALMQMYRASPEAAADLLALIRAAGGKPRR